MISVDAVDVGARRIVARVRVDEGSLRTSQSPGFAERALDALPGLARHTCECGSAHGIVAELGDTEVPHALEHITFELMALAGSPRGLRGATSWDFARDGRGVFTVALDYDDDLVALAALKAAVPMTEWFLAPSGDGPDIAAVRARLEEVRRRG